MYGKSDGPGQMSHFVSQDKFNVFRIPVGWQYLTNNADTATGILDPMNSGEYDL
jgi:endoglucanase